MLSLMKFSIFTLVFLVAFIFQPTKNYAFVRSEKQENPFFYPVKLTSPPSDTSLIDLENPEVLSEFRTMHIFSKLALWSLLAAIFTSGISLIPGLFFGILGYIRARKFKKVLKDMDEEDPNLEYLEKTQRLAWLGLLIPAIFSLVVVAILINEDGGFSLLEDLINATGGSKLQTLGLFGALLYFISECFIFKTNKD